MHTRELESEELDVETKATFLRDSIRGVVWQVGITFALVAAAHFASKLASDVMFTWH